MSKILIQAIVIIVILNTSRCGVGRLLKPLTLVDIDLKKITLIDYQDFLPILGKGGTVLVSCLIKRRNFVDPNALNFELAPNYFCTVVAARTNGWVPCGQRNMWWAAMLDEGFNMWWTAMLDKGFNMWWTAILDEGFNMWWTAMFTRLFCKGVSNFRFPRNMQVPDLFLDAIFFSCHVMNHSHQHKEFHFYFYYLFVNN